MAYELYKQNLNLEQYFATWSPESLETLDAELREQIYAKHIVKREVFRRDNFSCQNVNCHSKNSPLTLHHIKFRKNNGKEKVRNGVTLCRGCHRGYHHAKYGITFGNFKHLPSHIRGMTFKLHKKEKVDWKQIKSDMRQYRKTLKAEHGIIIGWREMAILLRWLHIPYEEWDD